MTTKESKCLDKCLEKCLRHVSDMSKTRHFLEKIPVLDIRLMQLRARTYIVVRRVAGQSVVVRCVADRNLLDGKGDNPEEERDEEKRRTKKHRRRTRCSPIPRCSRRKC